MMKKRFQKSKKNQLRAGKINCLKKTYLKIIKLSSFFFKKNQALNFLKMPEKNAQKKVRLNEMFLYGEKACLSLFLYF